MFLINGSAGVLIQIHYIGYNESTLAYTDAPSWDKKHMMPVRDASLQKESPSLEPSPVEGTTITQVKYHTTAIATHFFL